MATDCTHMEGLGITIGGEALSERSADCEYLQILHHAVQTLECEVESALKAFRKEGTIPRLNEVLNRRADPSTSLPSLDPFAIELSEYDKFLEDQKVPARRIAEVLR